MDLASLSDLFFKDKDKSFINPPFWSCLIKEENESFNSKILLDLSEPIDISSSIS